MKGILSLVTRFSALYFISSSLVFALTVSPDTTGTNSALGDRFGFSVDMDQNNVIVGAPNYTNSDRAQAGTAYIFENGSETAQLIQGFPNDFDQFGYSVAIHDDTAVVGAILGDNYDLVEQPILDSNGIATDVFELVPKVKTPDTGVIWIYRNISGSWTPEIGILNEDSQTGDWTGYSVDTEDNHIVAGAPLFDIGETKPDAGAVYVFTRYTNDWRDDTFDEKVVLDEAVVMNILQPANLSTGDWFGTAVAISNNTIVVGADGSDIDGNSSGAAYVFTRNQDGTWQQQARLRPSDAGTAHFFGRSVAIDGNTLVVGAYLANEEKGAVYVFKQSSNGTWQEAVILTDSSSVIDDHFGSSVAVAGSKVYVGAYRRTDRTGRLYLFEEDINANWSLASTMLMGGSEYDDYSFSVAGYDDNAVVGLPRTNRFDAGGTGQIRLLTDVDSEIDTDIDGTPNNTDLDDDADGVADINDLFPTNPQEFSDIDMDGFGDNIDAFVYNASESFDSDGDGIGNNTDTDDDNDNIDDVTEVTYGADPLTANPDDGATVDDGIASDGNNANGSSGGDSGSVDLMFMALLLLLLAIRYSAPLLPARK